MTRLSPEQVRFTVDEYLRIADVGLLEHKTELLEGRIVEMAPREDAHMAAVSRVMRLLAGATDPDRDWLVVQGTLYLDDRSAPEPDLHLFDVPVMTPKDARPLPILVIEVSDTSYRKDSDDKVRIYARAGIEDYWIVNVQLRRVEVYRQPVNASGQDDDWRYASVTHHSPGQTVVMLKRPTVKIPVTKMLP